MVEGENPALLVRPARVSGCSPRQGSSTRAFRTPQACSGTRSKSWRSWCSPHPGRPPNDRTHHRRQTKKQRGGGEAVLDFLRRSDDRPYMSVTMMAVTNTVRDVERQKHKLEETNTQAEEQNRRLQTALVQVEADKKKLTENEERLKRDEEQLQAANDELKKLPARRKGIPASRSTRTSIQSTSVTGRDST